jgi:hypothetical protein
MASEDPTHRGTEDAASQDRRIERAVLAFLLDQHPTRLRADELPFALDSKDFAEKDAVRRAARELLSVGLLFQDGELIGPSRAALHFDYLESE